MLSLFSIDFTVSAIFKCYIYALVTELRGVGTVESLARLSISWRQGYFALSSRTSSTCIAEP